ncbi:MAG: cation diffusion facilitator family transporter [Prolixibacteraceae bacterium]|nr:cation diffusion facilitator family transporter [Prolixibacteraceae bacterium]
MNDRVKKAQKVTWIGFFVNILLMLIKLLAGIFGRSAAMIADAVHSLSDFATDLVVVFFVKIAGKDSDQNHRYGHGKFETFATLIISFSLLLAAAGICYSGIKKIINVISGEILQPPTYIALVVAVLSIAVKEYLFRYTLKIGKAINSQAVIANGWHHRSDALSSIGTLLGIGGAIFIGGSWTVLDPLAGVIVGVFIVRVAFKMGLPSINELLETALSPETESKISDILTNTPGVLTYHNLKTRKIGNDYAIDVHIKLDQNISFIESHDIATNVEKNLCDCFGGNTQINIHTEPINPGAVP